MIQSKNPGKTQKPKNLGRKNPKTQKPGFLGNGFLGSANPAIGLSQDLVQKSQKITKNAFFWEK